MDTPKAKKYYVLLLFNYSSPSVSFETNDKEDAQTYARIMHKTNPKDTYVVVESLE